jgi:hypothetical protein
MGIVGGMGDDVRVDVGDGVNVKVSVGINVTVLVERRDCVANSG